MSSKQTLVFTILLLFFSLSLFSQNMEITIGPIIDRDQFKKDLDRPALRSAVLPISFSATHLFNKETKKTFVSFFSDFQLRFMILENYVKYTGVKKIFAETAQEDVYLHGFAEVESKMYIFYSLKYKERDEFTLYVNEVSQDVVVLGSPIKIQTYSDLKKDGLGIYFKQSENKKYFMFLREWLGDSKERRKFDCKVIDKEFSPLWNKEISIESSNAEVAVQSVDLDNDGNLFMVARSKTKKITTPIVKTYNWRTNELNSIKPGLPEGENRGVILKLIDGERAYVAGLNLDDKKLSYFINIINVQTGKLEKLSSAPLNEDFFTKAFNGYITSESWRVSDIVSMANGNIVVSIEPFVAITDSKGTTFRSFNAYIMAFNADGQFLWKHIIHKKQVCANREWIGHLLITSNDQVFVIYNDNPENMTKSIDDDKITLYTGYKKGGIMVHKIDQQGKANKYPMSEKNELENYNIHITECVKIDETLYFAPVIHHKGFFKFDPRNITFTLE